MDPSYRAYEGSKPRWSKRRGARADERADDGSGGRRIVCVRCRHHVTDSDARAERNGLHEHSQVNPHGFIWVFGCWRAAPGCVPTGNPTSEFTWFVGYRWQIVACGGCGLHLGWLFTGDDDRFWGLIVDRVVEAPDDGDGGG